MVLCTFSSIIVLIKPCCPNPALIRNLTKLKRFRRIPAPKRAEMVHINGTNSRTRFSEDSDWSWPGCTIGAALQQSRATCTMSVHYRHIWLSAWGCSKNGKVQYKKGTFLGLNFPQERYRSTIWMARVGALLPLKWLST